MHYLLCITGTRLKDGCLDNVKILDKEMPDYENQHLIMKTHMWEAVHFMFNKLADFLCRKLAEFLCGMFE